MTASMEMAIAALAFLGQVVCFWAIWKFLDHIFHPHLEKLKEKPKPKEVPPYFPIVATVSKATVAPKKAKKIAVKKAEPKKPKAESKKPQAKKKADPKKSSQEKEEFLLLEEVCGPAEDMPEDDFLIVPIEDMPIDSEQLNLLEDDDPPKFFNPETGKWHQSRGW
jgi:hypothetical protein